MPFFVSSLGWADFADCHEIDNHVEDVKIRQLYTIDPIANDSPPLKGNQRSLAEGKSNWDGGGDCVVLYLLISPFISLYLPILPLSPYISLYLPLSPHISPYLPISPFISLYLPISPFISLYLSLYLLISPSISLYLLISPYISFL